MAIDFQAIGDRLQRVTPGDILSGIGTGMSLGGIPGSQALKLGGAALDYGMGEYVPMSRWLGSVGGMPGTAIGSLGFDVPRAQSAGMGLGLPGDWMSPMSAFGAAMTPFGVGGTMPVGQMANSIFENQPKLASSLAWSPTPFSQYLGAEETFSRPGGRFADAVQGDIRQQVQGGRNVGLPTIEEMQQMYAGPAAPAGNADVGYRDPQVGLTNQPLPSIGDLMDLFGNAPPGPGDRGGGATPAAQDLTPGQTVLDNGSIYGGGDVGAAGGGGWSSGGGGADSWGGYRHGGIVPSDRDKKLEPRRVTAHEGEAFLNPEATSYYGAEMIEAMNRRKIPRAALARALMEG